jgi:hypothetical protein
MIVVVGWMMVPLTERSATDCDVNGCFFWRQRPALR